MFAIVLPSTFFPLKLLVLRFSRLISFACFLTLLSKDSKLSSSFKIRPNTELLWQFIFPELHGSLLDELKLLLRSFWPTPCSLTTIFGASDSLHTLLESISDKIDAAGVSSKIVSIVSDNDEQLDGESNQWKLSGNIVQAILPKEFVHVYDNVN